MLFDAVWMGVPTITMASRPPVGRIGTSLMTNLGLADWVASNADDYVERAVAFAEDIERLSLLRGGMRDRMRKSPVMDEKGFAGNVETTYRQIWHKWCSVNE